MRRSVGKAPARQFQDGFRSAVAPANFGLSDRSGTDSLAHLLRELSERDANCVITCNDGVGAYDHVLRSRIFGELYAHPRFRDLVPHVCQWYGSASQFLWSDETGLQHMIVQGEGGEQGDALMPALFSLALLLLLLLLCAL